MTIIIALLLFVVPTTSAYMFVPAPFNTIATVFIGVAFGMAAIGVLKSNSGKYDNCRLDDRRR